MASLEAAVFSYIPDNALVVRLTSAQRERVQAWDDVRWVGPYAPSYKIDPLLLSGTITNIRIQLFPEADASGPLAQMRLQGMTDLTEDTGAGRTLIHGHLPADTMKPQRIELK